jgi:drug/metabolite transporter (DMT)-like permease
MFTRETRIKGVLYSLLTAVLWGVLPIALKVSTGFSDTFTITWFRFATSFFFLFLYFVISDRKKLLIMVRPPVLLVLASVALGLNYLGYILGVTYTTPGSSQVIIQIGPILLGIAGILFFRERIGWKQGVGFFLAGLGMFFFYRDNLIHLIGSKDTFNQGVFYVVASAIAWVIFATMQKKLVMIYQPLLLNLFIFGFPTLLLTPFVSFSKIGNFSTGEWALMIFLGLNTLFSYGALALALRYVEANKISIIITLNPILTIFLMTLLSWIGVNWIEPEVMTLNGVMAALLVLTGAILAVAFTRKKE